MLLKVPVHLFNASCAQWYLKYLRRESISPIAQHEHDVKIQFLNLSLKIADIIKTKKANSFKAVKEILLAYFLSINASKCFFIKSVYNKGMKYLWNSILKLYDVVSTTVLSMRDTLEERLQTAYLLYQQTKKTVIWT